jgi:hypothetical protein
VSKAVVKNEIKHSDYDNVLLNSSVVKRDVVGLRSFDQEVFTYKMPKTALTPFYDKMLLLDAYNCVPYGYSN